MCTSSTLNFGGRGVETRGVWFWSGRLFCKHRYYYNILLLLLLYHITFYYDILHIIMSGPVRGCPAGRVRDRHPGLCHRPAVGGACQPPLYNILRYYRSMLRLLLCICIVSYCYVTCLLSSLISLSLYMAAPREHHSRPR